MKKINKRNVLIFPAGSEIGLDIYDSLKYNLHFTIYGASTKSNHAKFIYPTSNYIEGDFLNINEKNFMEDFNEILNRFNIDFIFPTHDSVALYLSENAQLLKATLICSDKRTTKISRSKIKIYNELKGQYFSPEIYSDIKDITNYPVFLKPEIGEGGKGTEVVYNETDVKKVLSKCANYVISEYLPGDEYTVDCFTNREGELLFIGPRTRERINMGISFRSTRVQLNKEFINIANSLNNMFGFRGSWFFQVKVSRNGKLKLLEFSVRQSTTMGLYRQLGVNFALLSLFDFIGYDVQIIFNDINIELDRKLHNSYMLEHSYNTLYIDFDDTLIVNDKVNTILMRLIYQCINKTKQVILITKHEKDLNESLKKYRINGDLFNNIIILKSHEKKSDYIEKDSKSIFIDNHFPERIDVKKNCNIPVFDVDAVESLIDSSIL